MSYAVGVDIGGTKIAAGVVDEHGKILEKVRHATPKDDPVALVSTVEALVNDLRTRHDIAAIGVGAAGFVSSDRRRVLFGAHVAFGDDPLADPLEDALGLPVVVENDANAAAWAEYSLGAGRGVPDQLMVAVGTGIGGGIIFGGRLYRGGHGIAAEIGHIGVVRDGRPCQCGRRGCLEQYASGSSLTDSGRAAVAAGQAPHLLEAAGGDPKAVTGAMITQLARGGEAEAVALFAELGDWLGLGIATFVAVLDPTLVILGGGVGDAGDVLLTPTRQSMERELTGRGHHPGPNLRLAALGNDAGLIGAADLARHDKAP
ncbi:MAG: glucokinase [Nocardioidaceae bacterium]|jgi:glucokinase|nr:glucokinase [Nocardioidaceae bacterium]